ncbi:HisA/HisF-related TIM barrel protein [Herbaspirillum huttiense]|uniref:HisA/HisF-related TIM barrel protein n=1 Tax=Herbaspirillum huttiense TaxID=863372 RepID=UPI0039AEA2BB
MRKRIIPVLLLDKRRRLVKTINFGARTYVGDPFNVIRLFNEKEVDEICILDIDASPSNCGPDVGFMKELASECFMPLAYGGALSNLAQCEELNRAGVEKFILGRAAKDTNFINTLVSDLGSQAVVACVDVEGTGTQARCLSNRNSNDRPTPLAECRRLQDLGVGEIILQSVDRDGLRTGYDLDLIRSVAPNLSIPTVALGGAGEALHLAQALAAGASAAASGSAFVFIGKLRAVLVNYPSMQQMDSVIASLP